MEMPAITRQMIGFHKAVFDNTFYGVTVLQDYTQNMMEGYMRQFPWVTDVQKKPFDEAVDIIKKTREEYKKAVDQGFARLEEMIDSSDN